MPATIMLSVITGPHNTQRYCFRDKVSCVIGRASDCEVQLSGSNRDTQISRHHCQVDIEPPKMWVTDLGSRNGTFVNGKQISTESGKTSLFNNDVLSIGGTSLHFQVVDCPFCQHKHNQPAPKNTCEQDDSESEVHVCDGECKHGSEMEQLSDGNMVFWNR